MDSSYLTQQVTAIIGQLHGLFDEIGVPSHDRDSREAEVIQPHLYCTSQADCWKALHRALGDATHSLTTSDKVRRNIIPFTAGANVRPLQ